MATIKLKENEIKKFIKSYEKFRVPNNNEHALAMFKFTGCVITVYKTGKILFQGENSERSASKWGYKSSGVKSDVSSFKSYAGSDEVGTGDFFGPIVVAAAYIDEGIRVKLEALGVQDSKNINDSKIIEIAQIIKIFTPHKIVVMKNDEYNLAILQDNMNVIKAKMHNKALIELNKKVTSNKNNIIDEFATEKNYWKYLQNEKHVLKNVEFHQKAEGKFIGVAAASIIARFEFLKEMNDMRNEYNFKFKLGAGYLVDEQIVLLSESILKKTGKLNFKNYKKTR